MTQARRSARARYAAMIGAATLLSGGVLIASSGAATATTIVHAKYKVTGSTFLKAPNFTLTLGPGTLAADLNPATGAIKATLTLPNATGSFLQFGIIPVTATTQFINDGPTIGKLNLNTGAVQTTSKITLRVVSLSVARINIPVGDSCQTSAEPDHPGVWEHDHADARQSEARMTSGSAVARQDGGLDDWVGAT